MQQEIFANTITSQILDLKAAKFEHFAVITIFFVLLLLLFLTDKLIIMIIKRKIYSRLTHQNQIKLIETRQQHKQCATSGTTSINSKMLTNW